MWVPEQKHLKQPTEEASLIRRHNPKQKQRSGECGSQGFQSPLPQFHLQEHMHNNEGTVKA
jgi:hypothetical protein